MRWIKAIGALLALVAVIVGPPLLLVRFVGSPIPADLTLDTQMTDTVVIQLLSLLVWAFWLQTVWCILVEAAAALRSRHVENVPGTFGVQALFARTMVALLVGALVTIPDLPATADAASPVPAPTPIETMPVETEAEPTQEAESAPEPVATERPPAAAKEPIPAAAQIQVERGDTLWALAETHLGDGELWSEIADLNAGRTMVDGSTFHPEGLLRPGWVLQLPAAGTVSVTDAPAADYVVRAGDTLSQVAADHLGDPQRYGEIFEASKQLEQITPLTDPNLIYPGQVLDLPGVEPAAPVADAPPPVEAPAPVPAPVEPPAPAPVEPPAAAPQGESQPAQVPATGAPDGAAAGGQEPSGVVEVPSDGDTQVVPDDAVADAADGSLPSWVWPGMVCGGALLAGSLATLLRQRRSAQQRNRRPGFVLSAPPAEAVSAEQSIVVAGEPQVDLLELVDQALRRTAAALVATGTPLPDLAAVEVTHTVITLHLRGPAPAPAPWIGSEDQVLWILPRTTEVVDVGPDPVDSPAPWPMLVTVGHDEKDSVWLMNLEGTTVTVTGEEKRSRDFARYVAAEVACNRWSRHTRLDLVGIAGELAPIGPDRIQVHDDVAATAAAAIATAVEVTTRLDVTGDPDAPAARATGVDPEPWPSQMVIVDDAGDVEELDQLKGLLTTHRSRTATALVLTGRTPTSGLEIQIDASGRLTVPAARLELNGVGLTAHEAAGCVTLLVHTEAVEEERAPALDGDEPWTQLMTTTGALRDQYRVERSAVAIEPAASVLEEPDEVYTTAAATTQDDLAELAPQVTLRVREDVTDADPRLEVDLKDWSSETTPRPRLSLLGPVGARTGGKALAKRRPYYTELFAYLALKAHGATPDEVAADIDITPARVRTDIKVLRDWLGADPTTDDLYLPDARESPAARARGIGVYQVVDALVDLDLFRRLRARGESGGPEGIDDLVQALSLVSGRPFEKLRAGGWGWVTEGVRVDQHAVCAVADVAHVVVTDKLARGDVATARSAAETALLADPDSETARLDMAAVLEAEGHTDAAADLVVDEVCNRSDDGEAPVELSDRSAEILAARPHLTRRAI